MDSEWGDPWNEGITPWRSGVRRVRDSDSSGNKSGARREGRE